MTQFYLTPDGKFSKKIYDDLEKTNKDPPEDPTWEELNLYLDLFHAYRQVCPLPKPRLYNSLPLAYIQKLAWVKEKTTSIHGLREAIILSLPFAKFSFIPGFVGYPGDNLIVPLEGISISAQFDQTLLNYSYPIINYDDVFGYKITSSLSINGKSIEELELVNSDEYIEVPALIPVRLGIVGNSMTIRFIEGGIGAYIEVNISETGNISAQAIGNIPYECPAGLHFEMPDPGDIKSFRGYSPILVENTLVAQAFDNFLSPIFHY